MEFNITEVDELKLIYFEILDGYSFDVESSLYIKHFSDLESHQILRKRAELFYYYSSEGVPHESELLKNAIESEEWSQDKEDHILELKYHISDNEKNLNNIIPQQRPSIEKIIESKKAELAESLFERKNVLGRSIEDLIDDDVNDFVIYLSFYRDKELLSRIEDNYNIFQGYEISRINDLNTILSTHYRKFSEEKLKMVSCLPMFLNKFGYCKDDIPAFLKKPIYHLTHHQSFLFSLGARNISVLSQAKGSPPDLNLDAKMDDLVKWYDIQHSLILGRKNEQD